MSFSILLPLPPSANRLWKIIRNKKTGRAGKALSEPYKRWRHDAGFFINASRQHPVRGPYTITIIASRQTGMDLGNIEKATSDLLQKMSMIQNDAMAEAIHIEWGDVEPGMMRIDVQEA